MAGRRGTIDSIKVGLGVNVKELQGELAGFRKTLKNEDIVIGVRLALPSVAELESKFITPLSNRLKNARGKLGVTLPVKFDEKAAEGKLTELTTHLNAVAQANPIIYPVIFERQNDPEDFQRDTRRRRRGGGGGAPPSDDGGGAPAGGPGPTTQPSGGGRGRRQQPPPSGGGATPPPSGEATQPTSGTRRGPRPTVDPARPRATNAAPGAAPSAGPKPGPGVNPNATSVEDVLGEAVAGFRRIPDAGRPTGPDVGAAKRDILSDISRQTRNARGQFQKPTLASDAAAREALRKLAASGDPRIQKLLGMMGMGDQPVRSRREQAAIDRDMPIVRQLIAGMVAGDAGALNEAFPGDPDREIMGMGDAFFGSKSRGRVRDAYIAGLPSKKAARIRRRVGMSFAETAKSGTSEVLEDNPLDLLISAMSDAAGFDRAPFLKKRDEVAVADPSGRGRSGPKSPRTRTTESGLLGQYKGRTMDEVLDVAARDLGLHRMTPNLTATPVAADVESMSPAARADHEKRQLRMARAQERLAELDTRIASGGHSPGALADLVAARERAFSTANPPRMWDVSGTGTQEVGTVPKQRLTSLSRTTPLPAESKEELEATRALVKARRAYQEKALADMPIDYGKQVWDVTRGQARAYDPKTQQPVTESIVERLMQRFPGKAMGGRDALLRGALGSPRTAAARRLSSRKYQTVYKGGGLDPDFLKKFSPSGTHGPGVYLTAHKDYASRYAVPDRHDMMGELSNQRLGRLMRAGRLSREGIEEAVGKSVDRTQAQGMVHEGVMLSKDITDAWKAMDAGESISSLRGKTVQYLRGSPQDEIVAQDPSRIIHRLAGPKGILPKAMGGKGPLHQRLIQSAYDRGDFSRGQQLQKRLEQVRGGWTRPSSLSDMEGVAANAVQVTKVGEHGVELDVKDAQGNQFIVPTHQVSAFTQALAGGGRWPAKDLTGRAMGGSLDGPKDRYQDKAGRWQWAQGSGRRGFAPPPPPLGDIQSEIPREYMDLLRETVGDSTEKFESAVREMLADPGPPQRDPWAGYEPGQRQPLGVSQDEARERLEASFTPPSVPGQSQLQVARLARPWSVEERLGVASRRGERVRARDERSLQARLSPRPSPIQARLESAGLVGEGVREQAERAAASRFEPPVPPPPPPPRVFNRGVGPEGLMPADREGLGSILGLGAGRPATWQQGMQYMGQEAQGAGKASPFGVMASSNPGSAMNVRVINWPSSFGGPAATSEGWSPRQERISVMGRSRRAAVTGVSTADDGGDSAVADPRDEGVAGSSPKTAKLSSTSVNASLARFTARETVGDLADRLDQVSIDISEALQKSPVRALSVAIGQIAQTVVGGRAGILERRGFAASAARSAGFAIGEERNAQQLLDQAKFERSEIQARGRAGVALPTDVKDLETLENTIAQQEARIEAIGPLVEKQVLLTEALTRGGQTQAGLLSNQQRQRFGYTLAREGRIQARDLTVEQRKALELADDDSLDANALTLGQQRQLGRVVTEDEEVRVPGILSRGQQFKSQAVGLGGIVAGTVLFTAAMGLAQQGLGLLAKVTDEAGDRIVGFGFTLRRVAEELAPTLRERGLAGAGAAMAEQRAAVGLPSSTDLDALTAFSQRLAGVQNLMTQTDLLRGQRSAAGISGLAVPGIGVGFGNGFLGTGIGQTPGAVEALSGRLVDPNSAGNAAVSARNAAVRFAETGDDLLGSLLSPLQGIEDFGKAAIFGEPNRRGFRPGVTDADVDAARQSAVLRASQDNTTVVNDLNASIQKLTRFSGEVPAGRFVLGVPNDAASEQTYQNLAGPGGIGASPEVAGRYRQAGIAIVGSDNQPLTGAALNKIFEQSLNSTLVPSLDDLLKSQELALSAQRRGIGREAAFQRQTVIPAQFAEQLLAQPLPRTPTAGVIAPGGGIDAQAAGAAGRWAGSIADARADLAVIAKQGERELIKLGVDPQMIGDVRALGTEIAGLKRTSEDLQLGLEQEQYNEQIFITKRGISDLIGLTGKQSAAASKLGLLQRAQIMDGRELSRIQIARSQRELNLQLAIARLQAPGETPEERAIRRQEAMLKAREQQRELDIGKRTTTRGFQIEDIGFDRSLRDAVKQLDLLQKGRSVSVEVRGIQRVIEAREALLGVKQAFLGTARDAGVEIARAGNRMITELESRLGELSEAQRKHTRRFVSGQIEEYDRFKEVFGGGDTHTNRAGQTFPKKRSLAGEPVPRARGGIDMVKAPTLFMAGEAGTEGVIVIRNPKIGMGGPAGYGGGGGPVSITLNMGGITVKNEADEDRLVRKVTRKLHEELALVAGG